MAKQMKVCANLQQDFTDAEKQQARENIGAASSTDVSNKSEIKVFEGGSSTVHKNLMTIYEGSSTGALAGITFNNESSNVSMVKKPVAGDGGKVLSVVEPGGSYAPYYEWQTINEVPDYDTDADAGKRLEVSAAGLIWNDSLPTRHVWGYELNPNQFTNQTSLTDFQVSSTGVTLHFATAGDYFVTGMFCTSNDNGTHPTGYIDVKYVVDDSKSSATYSRLDNNLGYWPIHSGDTNNYPGGYVHGMITSRFRIGTPGYINFKWYVTFANLTAGFTNSTSISGASYLCFPYNFASHFGNYASNVMAFYAEKI